MPDDLTPADLLIDAACSPEVLRDPETGLFPGTYRAPSQDRRHRRRLAEETGIEWLMPEGEARGLPWLRERFMATRPRRSDLVAYSIDARGRCVRCWLSRPEDRAAYDRLLRLGVGTAPLEGVHPPSIEPARPALPAHAFLLPRMWQAIAADEGDPVALPPAEPGLASADDLRRPFWRGLAGLPLEGEVGHG